MRDIFEREVLTEKKKKNSFTFVTWRLFRYPFSLEKAAKKANRPTTRTREKHNSRKNLNRLKPYLLLSYILSSYLAKIAKGSKDSYPTGAKKSFICRSLIVTNCRLDGNSFVFLVNGIAGR